MQQETGFSPFTPAVHSVFALQAALDELKQSGGWKARQSNYHARSEKVAAVLKSAGVAPLLADGDTSCVLTAYRLPPGADYTRLHDALKKEDIVIYAGQGSLGEDIFRISCMGEIDDGDMLRLTQALSKHIEGAGA
jgi:2-aminoethylphosphonate-pyruvate transaminase